MKPLPTLHTETLPNGVQFDLRLIPAGSFDMGSTKEDQDANSWEKPQRIGVEISEFYLGIYTVTQALWKAVMGEENNPSGFKGDERPVESVSWFDAQNFIKALNEKTLPEREKHGLGVYRLPTEAEWEYAARGGPLNARYRYVGSDKLKEVGWYRDISDDETHEVGLLMPNQLGLYDMSGNVWEWVEDHWHDNFKDAPKDGRVWLAQDDGAPRVFRGGSYFDSPRSCRAAYRYSLAPDDSIDLNGFRLALSPSLGQSTPAIL